MDKCPVCNNSVKDTDRACACGELLQPWENITSSGQALRERGLHYASRSDYLTAYLSFVQAMLSNPLDDKSAADAVRCLIHLERFADAMLLLKAKRVNSEEADALMLAINAKSQSVVAEVETAPQPHSIPPPRHRLLEMPSEFRAESRFSYWQALLGRSLESGYRDQSSDLLWKTVIAMEAEWSKDESSLPAYGVAASDSAVRAYLGGLNDFIKGDFKSAQQSFYRSLEQRPPVLNPAVYYLYLRLDMMEAPTAAIEALSKHGYESELPRLIRICERLRERLSDSQKRNLQILLNPAPESAPERINARGKEATSLVTTQDADDSNPLIFYEHGNHAASRDIESLPTPVDESAPDASAKQLNQ